MQDDFSYGEPAPGPHWGETREPAIDVDRLVWDVEYRGEIRAALCRDQ